MKTQLNIAIVDDDKLFTQLLGRFINSQDDMNITYIAHNGETFLAHYEAQSIDIVLLDLRMNDGSGLEVLRKLQKQSATIKIIVLSTYYRRSFMGQMLKLGVSAFLSKDIDEHVLIEVIQTVAKKGHYFSPDQLEVMREQLAKKVPEYNDHSKESLTSRETEILKLLCQQCTTKEIGERLFISPKTVETHKTNLLLKTGVKNTAGLIIYAIQNKIVRPDELLLLD
jgi:DNA-binding NarL/FixJ family response regulator